MCGRYRVRRADLLAAGFRAEPGPGFEEFSERPRFNIAPSQAVPIVRGVGDSSRELAIVRWGLIPYWTKGKPKYQPINAKCETVATSAMFRGSLQRRRCLVPADGFYEWQGSKPPKQPYFIHMKDDGVFAFAGLWDRWQPEPDVEPVETFTILTTSPNELMAPIHNRMPVILDGRDYDRWLDRTAGTEDVADLLGPYDAARMEAWPVSTRVNNVRNDSPELSDPVT